MRKFFQPLVVVAACSAAPLLAQDGDNPFSKLDKNGDGVVTKDEAGEESQAQLERLLKNNDIDGDGKLTKQEFDAGNKPSGEGKEGEPAPGERRRRDGDRPEGRPGPGAPDPRQIFKQFDANEDGKLSKEEAPERMRERFAQLDADEDGSVTAEEFARAAARFARPGPPQEMAELLFDRVDANSDGEITKDEIPEGRGRMFEEIMTRMGGDSISKEQFLTAMERMAQAAGQRGERRPGGPEGRPGDRPPGDRPEGRPGDRPEARRGDGPPPGRGPGSPIVRALDKDADGQISAEELEGAVAALKALDKNDDGKLTREEMFPAPPEGGFRGRRPDGPPGDRRPDGPPRDRRPDDRRPEGRDDSI